MKKIAILLGFCLIMAMLPTFVPYPIAAMTGSGTVGDPYVIYDVTDLQNMNNAKSAYYELANDIDASITSTWNGGAGFVPIGDGGAPFTGHFNGNNYTIDGLYINRGSNDQGLFGAIRAATITNVKLTDLSITASGAYYTGGLVGNILYSTSPTVIHQCLVIGDVSGRVNVGGLVGLINTTAATISECASHGTVYGVLQVGGLIGSPGGTYHPIILNCYSRSDVTAWSTFPTTAQNIGGLIGVIGSGTNPTNSYSAGLVSCGGWSVTNCRGFIGQVGGSCTACFWDIQTSGKSSGGCGTGKTTTEMKTMSTFTDAGWDFDTIWAMSGLINDGYPYLRWWYNPPTIISDVNQVVWFQPNTIIEGNTLPNRAQNGTLEDGNFIWGTNPAGIDIEMSEFYSDSQYPVYNYTLPSDAMAPSQDMLGPTGNPGWTPDFPSNAGNPFYPIVNLFAGFWNVAIGLLWPILAWLIIAIVMTLCYKYAPHQMITLFIGGGLAVFFYFWGVIPGWSVFVFVGMGLAIVIGERSPTVS